MVPPGYTEVDLRAIEQLPSLKQVLAQLHKRELITDDDVGQMLSQDYTGFGVWFGDPFPLHQRSSKNRLHRDGTRGVHLK